MSKQDELSKKIDKKLSEGREFRKTQEIRVAEIIEGRQDEKIVEGYATTFNEEYLLFDFGDYRVFEKIDPHAFDECDMEDVIMQYDHEGRVFARTRNKTLELAIDNHGLGIRANLGGTTLGTQVYEEIQGGYTDRMSFAFRVAEDKREETYDHEKNILMVVRTITKISKLYDVSAVSIPANDATEISARNFCDGVIAEIEAERLRADERKAQKKKIEILNLV